MEMKGQMQLSVLGVSRYEFEGMRGAKVFAQKSADPANVNVVGIEVIEFGCDFDIFEGFRGGSFPALFDCEVDFGRGARGKAAARVLSARPIKAGQAGKPEAGKQ